MAKNVSPAKRIKRIRKVLDNLQDELRAAVDESLIVSIHDDDGDVVYLVTPEMPSTHSIEFSIRAGTIIFDDVKDS